MHREPRLDGQGQEAEGPSIEAALVQWLVVVGVVVVVAVVEAEAVLA